MEQENKTGFRTIKEKNIPIWGLTITALLVFSFAVGYWGNVLISNQIVEETSAQVRYAAEDLDGMLDQMDQIKMQLLADDELRISYNHQPYSVLHELQNKLKLYTVAHPDIQNIWYHCAGDDYWYAGTASNENYRFMTRFYLGSELSDFYTLLHENNGPTVIRTKDCYMDTPCLLFFYNIYNAIRSSEHYAIFQIDTRVYEKRLRQLLDESAMRISLFNAEGQSLFDLYSQQIDVNASPNVITRKLQHNGLLLRVETTPVLQQALIIRLLIAATLILFDVVVLLVIRSFIIKYKQPFQFLRQTVASYIAPFEDLGQGTPENDYEYIESGIQLVFRKQQHLVLEMKNQKEAIRTYVLSSLLSGHITDWDAFRQEIETLGIEIPNSNLAIITVIPLREEREKQAERLLNDLKCFLNGSIVLASDTLSPKRIIAVVSSDSYEGKSIEDRMREWMGRLPQDQWAVGLSESGDDPARLPLLYAQACFSCSLRSKSPHLFSDEGENDYSVSAVQQEIEAIMKREDLPPYEETTSLLLRVLLCLGGKNMNAAAIDTPEMFFCPLNPPRTYYAHLLRILQNACVSAVSAQEEMDLIEKMKLYVHNNFDSAMFSIQAMAEYFSISSASLSSYFKSQTGILLTKYITDVRIHKAKQLLIETELPIQSVSAAVGYFNCNSFIRRFRVMTGLTPGEYRMKYRSTDK